MRAIISGGGTAGHINPALSIAEEIMKREPQSEILFIGTPLGMENTLVKKAGFPIKHIEIQGIKRSLSPENIKTVFMAFKAFSLSKKIIKEFRPDIVIGTGGYVCGPPLLAASKMNIPTIIHEQNVPPGMVVKMMAPRASVTAISFSETEKMLKNAKRVELTGNPLREGIVKMKKNSTPRPLVMISGGSLGAGKINDALFEILKMGKDLSFDVCASVGERFYPSFMEKIKEQNVKIPENVEVLPYIHNMDVVLSKAAIAVTRGGAITVSELCAAGKPAIIIPSPNVVHDHQTQNAMFMEKNGCGKCLRESELSGERLLLEIESLIADSDTLEKMSQNGKRAATCGAAEKIYCLSRELTQGR